MLCYIFYEEKSILRMETSMNTAKHVFKKKNQNAVNYNNKKHRAKYDCKLETFSDQELECYLIHSFTLSE